MFFCVFGESPPLKLYRNTALKVTQVYSFLFLNN